MNDENELVGSKKRITTCKDKWNNRKIQRFIFCASYAPEVSWSFTKRTESVKSGDESLRE